VQFRETGETFVLNSEFKLYSFLKHPAASMNTRAPPALRLADVTVALGSDPQFLNGIQGETDLFNEKLVLEALKSNDAHL